MTNRFPKSVNLDKQTYLSTQARRNICRLFEFEDMANELEKNPVSPLDYSVFDKN
jgi:hypothetical protein